jgi:transposase
MSAYVGLDIHSDHTFATVINQEGKIVCKKRMANDQVLSFLKPFEVEKVGFEASTSVAPIYRALSKEGYSVQVSHPKKTRYIAEARIKCDRVDSRAIAELVRLDALPLSYVPPDDIAKLREKVRRRAFLVRERSKLMTKIKSVLAYEGLRPPKEYGLFTKQGIDWLSSLCLEPID